MGPGFQKKTLQTVPIFPQCLKTILNARLNFTILFRPLSHGLDFVRRVAKGLFCLTHFLPPTHFPPAWSAPFPPVALSCNMVPLVAMLENEPITPILHTSWGEEEVS